MDYYPTPAERETIFRFDEAEKTATIFTMSSSLKKQLTELMEERPDEVSRDHDGDYVIPKKWIMVKPPRRISAEQKARLRKQGFQPKHTRN